ncbi:MULTISPECIES: MATE family efflux transporter [unclassified Agarivorans]|uniref:MATE family efflux transporter n=1 Tax=unclassified Agarivorans TaxID=2636026 RepID=UPI0026E24CCB|nr:MULTISPECIES: MATE family efflux transporter [unclassified Agarivorans]MDO6685380.1 MATE family efflux transporter [Agarivorans sp. 3_MG-2023]MDO6715766.1 MATE family efflux transporter [Agarivorans sp. 2_MG-2023]
MLSKNITQQFWRYSIPSVVAMIVSGIYLIVDGIFIGQVLGAEGLAAINLAWPIIFLVTGLGLMVGVGAGALISIASGEGDKQRVQSLFNHALLLMVLMALIFSAILALLGANPITWQGASGNIQQLAESYLGILGNGALVVLFSCALPILIRNDNSPNFATILMVIGALANIGLDYLFIVKWNWELAGAAYATLGAQAIVMLLALAYFGSRYSNLRFQFSGFRLNTRYLANISNLGLSSFFTTVYTAFITLIHNYLFLRYGSITETGAYAIVLYLSVIYYFIAEGFANGMQPLISYNYGAKRYDNVLKVMALGFSIILGTGVAAVLLMNGFSEFSVGVFNNDDPALLDATVSGIRLHLWAMPLDGLVFTGAVVFQSINRASRATFISLGNMAIQLPFMLVLPFLFGVNGIWLVMPLSTVLLSLLVAWWLVKLVQQFKAELALKQA